MLLQERVYDQNRDRSNDDGSHTNRESRNILLVADRRARALHNLRRIADHISQHRLQLPFPFVANIKNRGEEVIPIHDGDEQRDRGEHRLGQRQNDLKENAQVIRSVDGGSLLQRIGNAPKKAAHHKHVEGAQGTRQNESPQRVHQTEVFDQQVVGNHPAVEQHGQQNQERNKHRSGQPFLGDGVSRRGGKERTDQRPRNRHDRRRSKAGSKP